jgi:hypothetical protein
MAGQAPFGQISETDFSILLEMLSSNMKGRAFLNEYRRRFQPEDTLGLLDSLQRIEGSMDSVRRQLQPEQIADELRHIAMTLDIAIEGAIADEEGNDTARRFALAGQARRELQTLAASLSPGGAERTVAPAGDNQANDRAGYRLRDPSPER